MRWFEATNFNHRFNVLCIRKKEKTMKKKLASLIVMVAVLVSMLSTTVFADTESSKNQLETIKTQMEQTSDYLANLLAEEYSTPMDPKDIIDELSSDLF